MHLCFHSTRAIRALLLSAFAVAALSGLRPSAADGQTFTSTLHSEYQEVFDDGDSKWWSERPFPPRYPIEIIGVVINNSRDMLYYSDDPASPYYSDDPQWQVFFQATEDAKAADDFGGTAIYMRRYHPMTSVDLFPGAEWAEEMDRLNFPVYTVTGEKVTEPLQRGDLIKVEAKAPGMFFRGKNNVNTRHTSDPLNEFTITILERGVPLVAPLITLADLKDANDDFIFDEFRQYGCEHYQASLVRLEDLLLDDDPANWFLYNTVNVRQGDRTFPMQLGLDPALVAIDASTLLTTPFHVTAILNQEDASYPYTGTYSLWLTSAMDLTVVPEPGTGVLAILGVTVAILLGRRRRRR
ncbi:MAG: hypothetical protein RBS80_19635 [Thermoguttaceae bacterium]|jgi:hypothetical protein|nr:hypothetical protein [Thermoguttaceae bacterium]